MKKAIAALLICALVLSLAACGGAASQTPSSQAAPASEAAADKYSFCFLANTLNNSFQTTIDNRLKELCAEAGYDYVSYNPDYDVNVQLSEMSDAASLNIDVAFVIPTDSAGLREGLEALTNAGTKIINADSPVIDDDMKYVESVIATDHYGAGVCTGKAMAENMPNGGKIAILDLPQSEACVNRVNGFLEGLGDKKDLFEVVATANCEGSLDVAAPLVDDIIQAHPEVEAIYAINDPSALGAVASIKAAGRDNIKVYSVDASPEGKAAIVDGDIAGDSCQRPVMIAEQLFENAVKLMKGETIDKEILIESYIVTKEMAVETAGEWQ